MPIALLGAVAIARDENGVCEELASFGTIESGAVTRTLTLGNARNRTVEVRVAPLPDIESQATLNAVTILLGTIHDLERAQAEREERLTLWPIDEPPFEGDDSVIAGRMRELMLFARKVARTNVTVLITGESGTGKEVLAHAIHGFSARAKKPFVPFNCTAIPRELLESQLFGYRRGAFTGAERDNPGLIRTAKDGTLFLDEVGELGLDLQPKLLRFLESGEINPLGETSPFNVDVRIVAATNANLERLVEEGRFREDLFYRLNVICLSIPPLRERRDEIPGLVHHFVAKAAGEFGKGRVRVAEETMERLLLYSWPGNVRQLQNELRRMVALADVESTLMPSTLSKTIRQETMRCRLTRQWARDGGVVDRKAHPHPHPHRTRDDQGGAARESRTPRGHRESARDLAQRALPETPAARRVISHRRGSTRAPILHPSAQDACFEARLRSRTTAHAANRRESEWSAAALHGYGSRPFAATGPAPPAASGINTLRSRAHHCSRSRRPSGAEKTPQPTTTNRPKTSIKHKGSVSMRPDGVRSPFPLGS